MIFPILRGFVLPHLAPVTYFLLALNLLVFAATTETYNKVDRKIDDILSDRVFLETQGAAYALLIRTEPELHSATLHELASKALAGDMDSRQVLGGLAFRSKNFMDRAEGYPFEGDEIALAAWKERFSELLDLQKEHPSFQWGISRLHNDWQHWITYQFSHGGAAHLFWNMLFLVIFGAFVETRLGSSFVILTYLGGGLAGAFAFSKISGISSAPLVGASGAVSALMGLVAFGFLRKERLRFFFWLLPMRGYYGFASLPSWLVMIAYLLPDVSGYLASSREFGSVAYTAHLGGALFGAMIAGLLALGVMQVEIDEPKEDSDSQDPLSKAS